jgi:adenosylcobinamide kinase / adenosylcobinamide-phosphate guanylyltransferase
MLLITGGAYAGKRAVVREVIRTQNPERQTVWLSAYDQASLADWPMRWTEGSTLVMEGWEQWLRETLRSSGSSGSIRHHFREQLELLQAEERRRFSVQPGTEKHLLMCIMLEMGQGIVPLSGEDRQWRDLNGWLLQDGARLADEVRYVWHGLNRVLKPL